MPDILERLGSFVNEEVTPKLIGERLADSVGLIGVSRNFVIHVIEAVATRELEKGRQQVLETFCPNHCAHAFSKWCQLTGEILDCTTCPLFYEEGD